MITNLELFMQNIPNLKEAINLEYLRLEGLGLNDTSIKYYLKVPMVGSTPPKSQPISNNHLYYDAAADILWSWGDKSSYREDPNIGWSWNATNASRFNAVLRYYRQKWERQSNGNLHD